MEAKSEKVLVVPVSCLWGRVKYVSKGLIVDGIEELSPLIARCGSFVDRGTAETEPKYKQIIPYAVVRHFDSCFVLERKRTQGERRLHDRLSLGVGGHINPTEGTEATDMVKAGLNREVHEELCIGSNYRERLIGINDDTTEVGQVHLGVLFEIDNRSFDVTIRENEKMNGRWMRLDQLPQAYERLETWSQIVYDSYLCPETPNRPSTATIG